MVRIFAIHAHPDDVEILAGGTLALLADAGHTVTIATLTPGDCGSHELSSTDIADLRRRESAAAAAQIGASYMCLEMRDLAVFNDDIGRRRVTEALRQARPDIVLASSPVDYHCDHEAASSLARDACFAAATPNYHTGSDPIKAIPHLYFMDPVGGRDREENLVRPEFIVDVASVFDRKRAELAAQASRSRRIPFADGTVDARTGCARRRFAWRGIPAISRARLSAGPAAPGTTSRLSHYTAVTF
jgi:LmbE family N-acetylglucosaminyl deacetylase